MRYILGTEAGAAQESVPDEVPGAIVELVRAQLAASSVPLTAAGIEAATDQPKESLRRALDELVTRGQAEKMGAGRYRLVRASGATVPPPSGARLARRRSFGDDESMLEAQGGE